MDIVVNECLTEAPVAERSWSLAEQREDMLKAVVRSRDGGRSGYLGEVFRTIPADASAYHANLLGFLRLAWSKHLKVALAPSFTAEKKRSLIGEHFV